MKNSGACLGFNASHEIRNVGVSLEVSTSSSIAILSEVA